jgi:hypothetical protein
MMFLFPFLLGLALLGLGYYGFHALMQMEPRKAARIVRLVAGSLGVVGGGVLLLLRQPMLGIMLASSAGGLLFSELRRPALPKGGPRTSQVETYLLRMTLDHDKGQAEGEIIGGPYIGRFLSGLRDDEFEAFYQDCLQTDPDALPLLDSWLARVGRRRPGAEDEGEAEAGSDGPRADGPMTEEEACAILGVPRDASPDAIKAAYRRVIARAHPDKGGTDWLAGRVNAARDLLLKMSS